MNWLIRLLFKEDEPDPIVDTPSPPPVEEVPVSAVQRDAGGAPAGQNRGRPRTRRRLRGTPRGELHPDGRRGLPQRAYERIPGLAGHDPRGLRREAQRRMRASRAGAGQRRRDARQS